MRWSAHRIDCDHNFTWFLSLQGNRTALHWASNSGHDKVCQLLLQAGADVHAADNVSMRSQIISVFIA